MSKTIITTYTELKPQSVKSTLVNIAMEILDNNEHALSVIKNRKA